MPAKNAQLELKFSKLAKGGPELIINARAVKLTLVVHLLWFIRDAL